MRILYLGHQPQNAGDRERRTSLLPLIRQHASPGTEIDMEYPDDFPGAQVIGLMGAQNVLSGLHHAMATGAIVRKMVWAEQQGYDAVVMSNHFDPGVEAGRLAVRIPVIGLFRTALHTATTLADRLVILVPLESHVPYVWRILRVYGMERFVADIRPLGMYGSNLAPRKAEIFERAAQIMKDMVRETRAECIVPLGGAIIPYVVSPADLEREVGVPVTDNVAIGIRFAETCVSLGLSQSPRTYPPANLRYEDFVTSAF